MPDLVASISIILTLILINTTATNLPSHGVITVRNKFAGLGRSLDAYRAHDTLRQLRFSPAVDIPLGGTGRPDASGLYFAKIAIGVPSKDYYVQVDTGSNIIWLNCIQCHECPRKGSFGIDLTLYNLKESLTGKLVSCNDYLCSEINESPVTTCTTNMTCLYNQVYGDGSFTSGYLVQDVVQYDRVSGDLQTTSGNVSIVFGCGASQSGNLGSSDEALDGILGFGKSNSSMISQLASFGKLKKKFAHCLDSINGGGIFAIGNVVHPEVITTPLLPNQTNYNINMTAIEVGGEFLDLPAYLFEAGNNKGTIIDSGTTLAYLPDVVYKKLVTKIFSQQSDLRVQTVQDQYTCFHYSKSVDDGFPNVTFHFENSLTLEVYPREYLFSLDDLWCIGWQSSGFQYSSRKDMTLLGDLVLSNKLVIYDLENQVIGWTEYNCSASIKVRDEQTGQVHLVGSHFVSCSCMNTSWRTIILFLVTILVHIT